MARKPFGSFPFMRVLFRCRLRIPPFCNQSLAFRHPVCIIQAQNLYGHSPLRRQWLNDCTFKPEMLLPHLLSWIEKRYQFASLWIERTDIRTFAAVAANTGKREVIRFSFAVMLDGNYVVRFVAINASRLWHQAKFAASVSAFDN